MSVWRSLLAFVIAFVLGAGLLTVGHVLASAIAEAASNDPSGSSITGDGYSRGFGCAQDTGLCYAFGGGSLGSGSMEDSVWNYEVSSNTWAAQSDMPQDYHFYHNTSISSDRYVASIARSPTSACSPIVYDTQTDTWATSGIGTVPSGCGFGVVATAVGSTMIACGRSGDVFCYALNLGNLPAGWVLHSTIPAASNPNNGRLIYDENNERLVLVDTLNGTFIYEFDTGIWTTVIDTAPITGGLSAVGFSDNRAGPLIGEMHTPSTNSMEMYQLVYDEDTLSASTWQLYETWNDSNFNYCAASCGWRFSHGQIDLTGNSGETFLMFGSGAADDSTPATNASRWWAYQGNSTVTEIVGETGNIDFWIQESLTLLDLDDEFGNHLFGLFWLLVVGLMAARAGSHPLIMMFIVGITAVGFGQAEILPGWAILVAIIVVMFAIILRTMSGSRSEGEPV